MAPPGTYPIQTAMADANVAPGFDPIALAPDEYMRRLGALPLAHQPGERWLYHTGVEVAGVLIARAAGTPLDQLLHERIFAPLGMRDTSFSVPAANQERLATCYRRDDAGELVVWDDPRTGKWSRPPPFMAGGGQGGLASTVDDRFAFARMLLAGGRHGSRQILSPRSVDEMTTDQLTPAQKAASPFYPGFWDHGGWGLGMQVLTKPDGVAVAPGRYGWGGGRGHPVLRRSG